MNSYVLGFGDIDKTKLALVGGKGANLGELSRIEGIRVPEGFCITTDAYKEIIANSKEYHSLLDQLSSLNTGDREGIGETGAKIRKLIEGISIPEAIEKEIVRSLSELGGKGAYAVRSSATAEDLPTASFAGQQDTYLNVVGKDAILKHISLCWASLFTDRAVTYRIQNGFDHNKVLLSVVIQKMVFPEASGILFTADPVTSNRNVASIDASFGLGEALVSGLVNADNYKVRGGVIVDKKVSVKKLAIHAAEEGGTQENEIATGDQGRQALTDAQILELERIGRTVEDRFGRPQDIEWCLLDGQFSIVQSRPITTLYPVPEELDGKSHVYMSFSHQQMMTDAMKPLGLSIFKLSSDEFPLVPAGGRLYFDIAPDLASPMGQKIVLAAAAGMDPLMLSAIKGVLRRKDFMKSLAHGRKAFSMKGYLTGSLIVQFIKIYRSNDASIVPALMSRNEAETAELRQRIENLSGDELYAFVPKALKQIKEGMSHSMPAVFAGIYAESWVNKHMEKWLGEKGAADALSQSAPNNVTSEMGLALLDVADAVRLHPAVIDYFQHASNETFFEDLSKLEGGKAVSETIRAYLEKYGMRCPGEIDITRPRFSEQPAALVPTILSNVKNFEPNAHQALFERGLREAGRKEQELLDHLEKLPGGKQKAKKAKRMISLMRNFTGHHEYPKYLMIGRYWVIKQALLREADKIAQRGVIREKEDIYYLSFEELKEAGCVSWPDYGLITKRKEEHKAYWKLTPPRIMTNEGEAVSGEYDAGKIPKGALAGIPASSGTVEGRARVILRLEDAKIEEGDILVTAFTDPSWTPVFVSIQGLVAEVGGMMTHGSVIAREYGLPAVVGVENATRLIKDGQRIRVNGAEGYVEIL